MRAGGEVVTASLALPGARDVLAPVKAFIDRYRHMAAVRRGGRAAVVMPAMFAVADKVIGNPTMATFAAFGSFAMVLLVEFGGPMRDRIQAQLTLSLVGAALVCLGTLASRDVWLSVTAMAVVAFLVLFAGVVSSVLASATTSLLLAFILPVSLPGPVSSIPDRVEGWGLAAGGAMAAILLLWPSPSQDPLRSAASAACRALASRLRSDVACRRGLLSGPAEHDAAVAESTAAIDGLRRTFQATPYRPTGLSTAARTTVRLVDELSWMNVILAQTLDPAAAGIGETSIAVKLAAAEVLDQGSALLTAPQTSPDGLRSAAAELRVALVKMERGATLELPVARTTTGPATEMEDEQISEFLTSLDPSFRAQEVSFAVDLIASNIDRTVAAEHRSWWERLLGRQPEGLNGPWAAAQERAAAHLEPHSVWLHNSLRGAAGLAAAVLTTDEISLQHSFWVIFGALSVLRSNALNTGQNALRGVLGTVVGFAVGSGLLELIGTNTTVLWFLLPLAVLLAGVAPVLVSFAAGQAAFTLTIVILFNLVAPAGWKLGLIRVEDVAIGCAVSLVVGVLFWPRGASASLRKALAEAYADSARYLDRAVTFGALRCDVTRAQAVAPVEDALRAAAASRRLDDTFRTYLAERGAKPAPLAEMTSLVTGVAALRLAADAVVDLWEHDDHPDSGDRAAARVELLRTSGLVRDWYDDLAAGLAGTEELRDPLPPDNEADRHLIDAVRHDLRSEDGTASATAVRVIWTADHLDAARRLQEIVIGPARAAVV
jgi:uncharacterized membrane protein YccC